MNSEYWEGQVYPWKAYSQREVAQELGVTAAQASDLLDFWEQHPDLGSLREVYGAKFCDDAQDAREDNFPY